ncbi:MAG: glycosyltransferase, partial [Gammaproteobacteria bacterium]
MDRQVLKGWKVLIVTPDISGPIRNGGIGTAFAALARQLAQWGASPAIAYALGSYTEDEPIHVWQKAYAREGIRFIPLEDTLGEQLAEAGTPPCRRMAWKVHAWLSRHAGDFDLALFPEWMGLAYYALLAKGQGLAYRDLGIFVHVHSPEAWALEGNGQLPGHVDALERDFMERECVRRADGVVSPSRYMLDWMRERGWALPEQVHVIPNLLPDVPSGGNRERQRPEELVFFGRLELRKGLQLFCDAVDRLSREKRGDLRAIRFMGKAVARQGFDPIAYIRARSRAWGIPVEIAATLSREEALAALKKPGILAVIPSLVENAPYTVLECLEQGVPFLASEVGGIPELVSEGARASCLFPPNPQALSERLSEVLDQGISPARAAHSQEEIRSRWLAWFQAARPRRPQVSVRDTPPRVSICLVHHDRPRYLDQALRSIRSQTYPHIEVILVDDGSPSRQAQTFLDTLEPEFRERGWQIIRQSNRYLGAARNRAAQAAGGEYLLFMDDDNIALPHEVATFVQAALHSGADVLTCVARPFTGDVPPAEARNLWLPLGGAAGAGIFRNVFGDANALWRREAFFQAGGYTTDYGLGHEDWELFAEAVLRGLRLEVVPEPLFWYRVSSRGMLRSGDLSANYARGVRPFMR